MNYLIKFIFLLLKRLVLRKPQKITNVCISHYRVGVFDLDLNFHMNNGRFFSMMDLGRFDLLIRSGHFYKIFTNKLFPVVLSEAIIFKESLHYFQKYEIHTHINNWDDKFFYITQKFVVENRTVATAHVRACFKRRNKKGIVSTKDLFNTIGEPQEEIKLSPTSLKHIELDNLLHPRN